MGYGQASEAQFQHIAALEVGSFAIGHRLIFLSFSPVPLSVRSDRNKAVI